MKIGTILATALVLLLSSGCSGTPPKLEIAGMDTNKTVETVEDFYVIKGIATDEDEGVQEWKVFVNGEEQGKTRNLVIRKKSNFEKKVTLDEGDNEITLVAIDKNGNEVRKTVRVYKKPVDRSIYAAVIGISDYQNVPKLKYAADDAKEFHRFLTKDLGVPEENITLLLNEDAVLPKIKETLGITLMAQAAKHDTVFIYYAGHGAVDPSTDSPDGDGLEKYLLPVDAERDNLYATALPVRDIAVIFDRIKSDRIVMYMDACYAGASNPNQKVRTLTANTRATVNDGFLRKLSEGKGRIVITAAGASEVAEERDEYKHGVFTHYLLKALRGDADVDKDGLVSLAEGFEYVFNKVNETTKRSQTPMKLGDFEGTIYLSNKKK
ncbi:MAG: caspase family protein [Planctomycetota bacterium]|jgi:hypothetical protein